MKIMNLKTPIRDFIELVDIIHTAIVSSLSKGTVCFEGGKLNMLLTKVKVKLF